MASVRSDVKRTESVDHVMITKSNQWIEVRARFFRASQLTSCSLVDIELPEGICKLILTKETRKVHLQNISL